MSRWGIALTLMLYASGPAVVDAAVVRLSAQTVIDRILAHSLQVAAVSEDVGMAEADLLATKGLFDLQLGSQVSHRIDQSARSAPAIFGTRTDTTAFSLDLAKRWGTGTETSVGYAIARDETTGSAFIPGLMHSSTLMFGLRQPVLNNLAGTRDRKRVGAAREALRSTDLQTQYRIQQLVRDGLGLYWQWVFARDAVTVADAAIAAAQDFLVITREKYQVGTALGTDLFAAQANVEQRRAASAEAQARVIATEGVLRNALRLHPQDDLVQSARSRPPSPRPLRPPIPRGGLRTDTAIARALATRGDYLAARHAAEQLRLQLAMERNSTWPRLDLVSTLALNQLADTTVGSAVRGMDNPNWLIGMEVAIPLPNRAARGARDRAQHAKSKAVLQLKGLEEAIAHSITELSSRLGWLSRETSLRVTAERLRQQKQLAEEEQYRIGRSSSELVIRAQDDYFSARLATLDAHNRLTQAWLDYQLAIAQLW